MDSFVAAPLLTEAALCAFQEAREAFFLFHPHDYRILAANPAAERATGLTADQLRARRITDLFDTTDERDPAAVVNSAAVAEPQILSLHGGRLDPVSVHVRVRPVAAAPEPLGLAIVELVLEQELHEKRRVEAELVKVKGELIRQTQLATLGLMSASVAHDLRNPLGAVRNAAYYLRRKVPATEPKWVEYLAIIDREVVFCDQIITNMLELARSRAPVPEMLDLGELVRAAFQSARPLAEVHCQFQAATEPFRVHADPAQFRQVFDNLVKNSLDALAGRGAISSKRWQGAPAVLLSLSPTRDRAWNRNCAAGCSSRCFAPRPRGLAWACGFAGRSWSATAASSKPSSCQGAASRSGFRYRVEGPEP